ncbi:MAG: Lar family restriction alleviation protein [Candidatus Methanomethylophilaceae archaeon]
MSSETELKPCPFCGGRAEKVVIPCPEPCEPIFAVQCTQCKITTMPGGRMVNTAPIEIWNRRVKE